MSFPRYDLYRESGVEWVGPIPSHWLVNPLLSIAEERDQRNLGMQQENLLSLSYGRIVKKDISSNDGLLPESFETYQIVEPNDIVWRLTDLQNDQRSLRTAIVDQVGIITSAYLATSPRIINPSYLNHLLRAYDLTKVFYSMGGGLRQSMKYSDVKRLPILLPSRLEQTSIANFLDRETSKIDTLIQEQQRLIELLKEKRQAVISHAVTKGLNPDAPMKDSGVEWLGEVPEHWTVSKLGNLSTDIGDGLHGTPEYEDETECYFINGNNLVNGAIAIGETTRCVNAEIALRQRIELSTQTLLISINGTIGNIALYQGERVMLGKSAAYINCASELRRSFLSYFLQSTPARSHFQTQVTGTTISNLSLQTLRNIQVPVPPLEEQQRIQEALQKEVGLITTLEAEVQAAVSLLQERRSALISAAVTGKIDVRGLVSCDAEAA